MKNTAVQIALNALSVEIQRMERTASGTVSWEERYYQERADHNANLATVQAQLDLKTKAADRLGKLHDELTETIEARDDALKGWIAVADERERRFNSSQDDLRGMVSVLNDERAQSTAKIKALETELTEVTSRLHIRDIDFHEAVAQVNEQNDELSVLRKRLETAQIVVNAQRVVINDLKAQ